MRLVCEGHSDFVPIFYLIPRMISLISETDIEEGFRAIPNK